MGIVSIDTLMKIDRGLITEVPTKEVRAKRLSKIAGTDVVVKIKALSGNTFASLLATSKDKKDRIDASKLYKAQSLIVAEGVAGAIVEEPGTADAFWRRKPGGTCDNIVSGWRVDRYLQRNCDSFWIRR